MSQEQCDALEQMIRQAPLDLSGDLQEQRVILIEGRCAAAAGVSEASSPMLVDHLERQLAA
jgi:hypothetical protein